MYIGILIGLTTLGLVSIRFFWKGWGPFERSRAAELVTSLGQVKGSDLKIQLKTPSYSVTLNRFFIHTTDGEPLEHPLYEIRTKSKQAGSNIQRKSVGNDLGKYVFESLIPSEISEGIYLKVINYPSQAQLKSFMLNHGL